MLGTLVDEIFGIIYAAAVISKSKGRGISQPTFKIYFRVKIGFVANADLILIMMGKTSTLNDLNDHAHTPESLRIFLEWLASGVANPCEAYESVRRRLTIFFAGRKCLDPEALSDRTLDCAMRKLPDIPAEANPMAYLIGIAKNIYRDELRAAQKVEAFRLAQAVLPTGNPSELEARHTCLEKCLAELPAEDRTLVLGYYSESKQAKIDKRKQLADRFGLNLNALRNRIFRLNQRLAHCVTACLENSPA